MAKAYYNEFDPKAAAWLRNLIEAGLIAPGDVDERSIVEVRAEDLAGYTQCHFFAGIGVWSYALRNAGWPDSEEIWTASCPCQPFSSAGKRGGFDDERHLWPHLRRLIQERSPPAVLGEQVASKAVEPWIDLVQADVEAMDYAFGCIPFPSAGVGAPHIRDRAFWVADASSEGLSEQRGRRFESARFAEVGAFGGLAGSKQHSNSAQEQAADQRQSQTDRPTDWLGGRGVSSGGLADSDNDRSQPGRARSEDARHGHTADADGGAERVAHSTRDSLYGGGSAGASGRVKHSVSGSAERVANTQHPGHCGPETDTPQQGSNGSHIRVSDGRRSLSQGESEPGPTNGFWRDADWLFCRDGKWRPVAPGTFPLAHGAPARVVRLRAYGNAINAEAAQAFIESWLEVKAEGTARGNELGRSDLDDLI